MTGEPTQTAADRRSLIEAGNALAEIVSCSIPDDHHERCDSRAGKECDCYMRRYEAEQLALATWIKVGHGC